ncbi:MAG: peptidoglycan-binding protein [Acidimicrobiia bacterium]|nr:peptidoglycan-binding protein [Acidimicrobiia bacterium]
MRPGAPRLRRIVHPPVLLATAGALLLVVTVVTASGVLREPTASGATRAIVPGTLPASTSTSSTSTSSTTTTAPPPTTTTTEPPPSTGNLPPTPPGGLRSGSQGPDVLAYEQRLAELRFDPGAVDGVFDQATQYAVHALQKLVGADRTGRIEEGERFALTFFTWPDPVVPDAEPNRTEVDVTRQVLILWAEGRVRLVTTISTGSGVHYCYTPKGQPDIRACEYAYTPSGRFEYYRFHRGWEKSPSASSTTPSTSTVASPCTATGPSPRHPPRTAVCGSRCTCRSTSTTSSGRVTPSTSSAAPTGRAR